MNVYKPDIMSALVLFVIVAIVVTMSVGTGNDLASGAKNSQPGNAEVGLVKMGVSDKAHGADARPAQLSYPAPHLPSVKHDQQGGPPPAQRMYLN